jgi:hypothetical protein
MMNQIRFFNRLRVASAFWFAAAICLVSGNWFGSVNQQAIADDPPGFVFKGANQDMNIEVEGKLAGFKQGMLLLTRDDGVEVTVKPPQDALGFDFQAPVEFSFLQRGMMIRFNGNFNQTGTPADPVEGIEIFLPLNENLAKKNADQFVAGVYPGEKKTNLPEGVANYKVVGKLMGWDATGLIAVQAGRKSLRVQLAEKATLGLRLNQLNLAQSGDAVTVNGSYRLPDDTKIVAKTILIVTDRVQTGATAGTPTTDRPKRGRRGADADAAGDEK